jgi:hypothetical protein
MTEKPNENTTSDTVSQDQGPTAEEAIFIHGICTPLTVALMQVDQILHSCAIESDVRDRLNRAFVALKKMEMDITQRRAILRQRRLNENGDPTPKP